MSVPASADEFLDLVRKSGLFSAERIDRALDQARALGPLPSEPKKLASLLIRHGLLTYFYAEQFLRGVYRGFDIGKYQILERIGSGGMGIVYLAQHKVLEHRVAIKVLPVALADHPWFRKRFYQEAQAVAALNHPNIVRAMDIGNEGKIHFLVMEFVDGSSLQDIVGKYGAMAPVRAANYVGQAARGLQHFHEVGIVHRDIKPGNLLLDSKGVIKILDLGLARFFQDSQRETLSASRNERTMVGTDDYLAPEQIVNSDDVDVRADIYSLGSTFYFLLTGYSPFETEDRAYHKLLKHLAQKPQPIQDLRPEAPADMVAVAEKMMAKNPWQRYQTPAAVVEALSRWLASPLQPPSHKELPRLCSALQPHGALEGSVPPVRASSGRSSAKFDIFVHGAPRSGPISGRVGGNGTPPSRSAASSNETEGPAAAPTKSEPDPTRE
jgi:serine/threonine protein kinase